MRYITSLTLAILFATGLLAQSGIIRSRVTIPNTSEYDLNQCITYSLATSDHAFLLAIPTKGKGTGDLFLRSFDRASNTLASSANLKEHTPKGSVFYSPLVNAERFYLTYQNIDVKANSFELQAQQFDQVTLEPIGPVMTLGKVHIPMDGLEHGPTFRGKFSISPDGERIGFLADRLGHGSGDERALIIVADGKMNPVWSALHRNTVSGSRIAVSSIATDNSGNVHALFETTVNKNIRFTREVRFDALYLRSFSIETTPLTPVITGTGLPAISADLLCTDIGAFIGGFADTEGSRSMTTSSWFMARIDPANSSLTDHVEQKYHTPIKAFMNESALGPRPTGGFYLMGGQHAVSTGEAPSADEFITVVAFGQDRSTEWSAIIPRRYGFYGDGHGASFTWLFNDDILTVLFIESEKNMDALSAGEAPKPIREGGKIPLIGARFNGSSKPTYSMIDKELWNTKFNLYSALYQPANGERLIYLRDPQKPEILFIQN